MKTKVKRWLVGVLSLVAIVGVLAGIKVAQIRAMMKAGQAFTPPPESVTTAGVESDAWAESTGTVGSLVAVHGVTLRSELAGTIRYLGFDSGATVHKGDLLVRLDTSNEEAQLASALADASLTRLTLDRALALRQGQVNAPADVDAATAHSKQAEAQVDNLRATIAKKSIHAPFDGRLGIRQAELGQVVSSETPLVSLQSVDPIYAEFWLTQQALAHLELGQEVRVRTDAFAGDAWTGEVSTINTEIDPATRNLRVRAQVPNRDGRLRPGMFVNVEVLSGKVAPVLAIPATSVIYAPYGDSVFVLEQSSDATGQPRTTVRQQFVRLGERRGDLVAVTSGIRSGQKVVTTGAFKLRNGAPVVEKNELAPSAELSPTPRDE